MEGYVFTGLPRPPPLPARAARQPEAGRDRPRHPGEPGRHRRRRDRVGQDDAAAQDLPRARAREHRPHPAAPARRPHHRRAHRGGAGRRSSAASSATRCASPTRSAPDTRIKLMTDGILLNEIHRDRTAAQVRHDHHRRGARAQPQHRLPPRLPQAAAAEAARPQGDRHLGDDRPAELRRHFADADGTPAPIIEVSGRTFPVEIRYRPLVADAPGDDDDDEPPDRSSADRTTCRASTTPSTSWPAKSQRRRARLPLR